MYGMRNSIGIGVQGNIALTIMGMLGGGGSQANAAFDLVKTLGGLIYFPGVGTVDSIPTGNYTDTAGTVVSSVNGPVARVNDGTGTAWYGTQNLPAYQPILQMLSGKYLWNFTAPDAMTFLAPTTWVKATVITITSNGATVIQNQNVAATNVIVNSPSSVYGVIILPSSPTQSQLQLLLDYANNQVSPLLAAALVILRASSARLWLPGDAVSSNGLQCLNYSDAAGTIPAVQGGPVLVIKDALGSTDNAVSTIYDAGYKVFSPTLSTSLGKDCIRSKWSTVPTHPLTGGSSNITFNNTLNGTATILTARQDGVNNYTGNLGGGGFSIYDKSSMLQQKQFDFNIFFGALEIIPQPSAADLATLLSYMHSLRPKVGPDPYFQNVSLLCHLDDAADSVTPLSILDKSPRTKTGVVVGTYLVGSIAPSTVRYGTSSLLLPGYATTAGNYVLSSQSTDFDFGAGDFTIEFGVKGSSPTPGSVLLSVWNSATTMSWRVFLTPEQAIQFWANGVLVATTRDLIYDGGYYPPYHSASQCETIYCAIVRYGNLLIIFADGYQMSVTAFNATIIPAVSTSLLMFRDYDGIAPARGVMLDEVRITKGIARYTANYKISDYPFPDS
jgi:hypothetical protein